VEIRLDMVDDIICNISTLNDNTHPALLTSESRINVALSGTAIQSSSTLPMGKAENAIDGNSDPVWEHYSCSSTVYQVKPWWRLELPGVYRVSEIQVTNRIVSRERLDGVEIAIGNSLTPSKTFINLHKSSEITDALTFCEVKVYGGRYPVHHNMIIKV
uniref:Fucolectin tachylectin-4 pentraxin-1 domain-containing protein n=1 Tax=Gadus morhua TaxID=8049 RepID=A0A8C5B5J3_GADMO